MARVLISMDDAFLQVVDEFANKEHRSRSELIREALRTYMRKNAATRTPARIEEDAKELEAIFGED
jgi:CopG family transcriptional regulator / antitoxin EndoAI